MIKPLLLTFWILYTQRYHSAFLFAINSSRHLHQSLQLWFIDIRSEWVYSYSWKCLFPKGLHGCWRRYCTNRMPFLMHSSTNNIKSMN